VGRVVAYDPANDLAVIRVDSPPGWAEGIPLTPEVSVGDPVYVIGYPIQLYQETQDVRVMSEIPRVASGTVSWLHPEKPIFQFDVPTDAGNSGGPVVSKETGGVAGLVVYARPGIVSEGYFGLRMDYVAAFLDQHGIEYEVAGGLPWEWLAGLSLVVLGGLFLSRVGGDSLGRGRALAILILLIPALFAGTGTANSAMYCVESNVTIANKHVGETAAAVMISYNGRHPPQLTILPLPSYALSYYSYPTAFPVSWSVEYSNVKIKKTIYSFILRLPTETTDTINARACWPAGKTPPGVYKAKISVFTRPTYVIAADENRYHYIKAQRLLPPNHNVGIIYINYKPIATGKAAPGGIVYATINVTVTDDYIIFAGDKGSVKIPNVVRIENRSWIKLVPVPPSVEDPGEPVEAEPEGSFSPWVLGVGAIAAVLAIVALARRGG